MKDLELVLVLACVLVLVSILASKASGRSGVPALLLFLGIGMLAGSEGLGGIYFDNAELARSVGIVALALILFSGGLDTRWAAMRPVLGRGVLLATVGTLVTAGLVGGLVMLVTDSSPLEALLLGAVVSSTDAAAVFTVLRARQVRLPTRVRDILELESGSNDPMAVFLTVSVIALITEGGGSPLELAASFVLQMGLGAVLGYTLGRGMAWVISHIDLDHDGLYPVLSLTLVLLTYGVTAYLGGSGFLAVYIAGIVMAERAYIHKRSLMRFHDGLAWLMQIAMFLTLGLLVFPSRILPVLGVAVLITAFLILVARPVAVYLSLLGSRFSLREQTLIGWAGLRGAVPIILATFPLVAGIPGGEELFNIVFFIVLASTLLQGTTIPAVARWLRVEGPAYEAEPVWAGEPVRRDLVEYRVPDHSPIVGRQVAQAGLPAGADVVLLRRYDTFVVVRGSTRLRRQDVLLLLADEVSQRTLDEQGELVREQSPLSLCGREERA
jgi:cell volume regulation protein A